MWVSISEKHEVSNFGEIRNKATGKILKQFKGKDGYLRIQLDRRTQTVHRVVAKAFCLKTPGKDFVNHIDGNKKNNSADNLEWCTRSENIKHAYTHGLIVPAIGEQNGRSKLKSTDVKFIKDNYKKGDSKYGAKALAAKYNVAHQTICAVVHGQNW